MSEVERDSPRLLDLFCKQGGAAKGYSEAGFDVVGVDIEPQPRNPFPTHVADAIGFVLEHGREFDAVHASPPCQRYIIGGRVRDQEKRPDLVGAVRAALEQVGRPWVIENVPGAPLRRDLLLCGSHFDGLQVRRHRVFETSFGLVFPPGECDHTRPVAGVYGHPHGRGGAWPGMLPSTLETWSQAMGIDWMDARGLAQAIPPAYTRHIGARLMMEITR